MGKLLIVAIFIVAAVITLILLSVQDKTDEVPELTSSNLAELQAKALCHEAIVYGMKQINEGTSGYYSGEATQTYTNFEVMDGTIDSIQFISNTTNDTIEIISYASVDSIYQNADETIQHKSSALVCWVPTHAQGAMYANGDINVGGSADITGNLYENCDPVLDFEEFFGITKAEMEAIADNHLVDPPNNPAGVTDITWVSFSPFTASPILKVTNTNWEGKGILIVEGDAEFQGGSFEGIMWITGELFVNGNNGFNGAIYVEGGVTFEDVSILGDAQITYDRAAITEAFADAALILDYELKIISWFEDE